MTYNEAIMETYKRNFPDDLENFLEYCKEKSLDPMEFIPDHIHKSQGECELCSFIIQKALELINSIYNTPKRTRKNYIEAENLQDERNSTQPRLILRKNGLEKLKDYVREAV